MQEFHNRSESRSFIRRLGDAFTMWRLPIFGWIQVEVSSHCTGECLYCPHTVFKDKWQERLMSLETFRKLLPALKGTRLAYLQGWGEPFTNPHIFDMIHLAQMAGCRVGTSTNGMLLDSEKIEKLVDCELDIIAFSLAGSGQKNDSFRKGTNLKKVLSVIRQVNDTKLRHGKEKPDIHIAYLLLRSAEDELPALPELLKGLNVSQVVVSTLDFVPEQKLAGEVISKDAAGYSRVSKLLDSVAAQAEEYGIDIHYSLAGSNERRQICTENVDHSLFISSDGSVSPCVFRNIPIKDSFITNDAGDQIYERLQFGNGNSESMARIWHKAEYKSFRKSFFGDRIDRICLNCPKLYITQK